MIIPDYKDRENEGNGLYYYRARYYNSLLQRFVSEDPIGFRGGINKYSYVANSPLNWVDAFGTDKNKKGCPDVPFHPGGADIDKNIAEEESNAPLLPNLLGAPLVLEDFYQKVRNHGPWDYKQGWTLNDYGSLDRQSPFEDFGNFNYGATAAALGVPESAALRLAGWASTRSDPSRSQQLGHWWGGPPYGDDPADQVQIMLGYDYYNKGCHQ
jgi:RHS repeat-associated protein